VTRREITDEEWELVEPLLPIGRSGPYPEHLREHFEGVIWRFRTGSPWRDMPAGHGVWQTVYHSFQKWRDQGVFQSLMDAMIAEAARRGQADLSLVSVDSTTARAHHDAAGMAMRAEVLEALEEAAADEKGARERHKSSESPLVRSRQTPPTPSARSVGGYADGVARD
jgi:transposase